MKDAYVLGHNQNLRPLAMNAVPAVFSDGYISYVPPWYTGWTWPATQPFAPGCTLDCGRCAVTVSQAPILVHCVPLLMPSQGGTIQLLYSPPGLSHPATEGPVVATTLGTVLTSPTYYISFESLYASDACNGVGSTITSTILAVPTEEPLSTLFATTQPCFAHLENNPWLGTILTGTASFNVTDLLSSPVPYGIYTSQPYCASEIFQAGCDPSACPTTLPYRPLIVLSSDLLNTLDPAWATCSLDLRGFYDPPKALTPATAAEPSLTAGVQSTSVSATPASGPTTATPAPTPATQSSTTTTAEPESVAPASSVAPAAATSAIAEASTSTDLGGIIASVLAGTSQQSAAQPQQASDAGTDASVNALTILSAAEASATAVAQQFTSTTAAVSKGEGTSTQQSADPATPGASQAGGVVVNGQTVQGAQTTTVNGVPISVASNAAVIAGSTVSIPPQGLETTVGGQALTVKPQSDPDPGSDPAASAGVQDPSTFTFGTQAITATPGLPLVVAGSTLASGSELTVNGQIYSQGSAGLVIGGTSTVPLQAAGSGLGSKFTIGTQAITASPGQPLIIAGSTLLSGSAITVNGQTYSRGSSGLVVGGTSTILLAAAGSSAGAISTFKVGTQAITATAGQPLVIAGSTLGSGSVITANGQTYSQGSLGLIVDGTSTIPLAAVATPSVITIGSLTVTQTPGRPLVISGSTISPGGPAVVIGSQTFSEDATALVVDGSSTIPLAQATSASVLTIGSLTITETPGRPLVVGSATLSAGGSAITVQGETISDAGSALIVNGSVTVPITRSTASASNAQSGGRSGTSGAALASSTKASSAYRIGVAIVWSVAYGILVVVSYFV